MKGKVYLVGAGPGDEGLITVKAVNILREADVVVYDYLASINIDKYAPRAEKIYVGKSGRKHTTKQKDINALLVKLGKEGKRVVRFKGGDPFIFGRGGEEALSLFEAQIDFEVVPGVTSAYSVPEYAGIPITQRGYASTVTFVTGHEDPSKEKSNINWSALAKSMGTIVFLMGVKNIDKISNYLIKYGRSAKTPVALIRWGATAKQEVLQATLKDIAKKVRLTKFLPPAIIVVGDVVKIREKLRWFEKKPLFGKKIVVTRSRRQAGGFIEKLSSLGAVVIELPVIKIEPADKYEKLDKAIERQKTSSFYDWIIFSSVNAVTYFIKRLKYHQVDFRIFKGVKIAAVGASTAAYLESLSLKVDLVPKEYKQEGVLASIGRVKNKKILIPRAKAAREVLPEGLKKAGAIVEVAETYKTVANKDMGDKVKNILRKGVDVVTFTSSSTVTNFLSIVNGLKEIELLSDTKIAAIGPVTAKTAKKNGLKVDIEAKKYTIKGLVKAIVDELGE